MKQIKEEMQGRGFAHFDWNCSAQDATIPLKTVDEIYNSVVYSANLQQDLVVLIHDSQNHINSAKALPAIIEYFQKNGYVFDKITAQTKPVQFSR